MEEPARKAAGRATGALRLVLLLALLALVLRTVQISGHRRARDGRLRVNAAAAGVLGSPSWLTEADRAGITRAAALDGYSPGFFDPGMEAHVREAYLRSPWVRGVRAVRKVYPNRVRVALDIREPVAGVLIGDDRIVLLDREGTRLPGTRRRPPKGLLVPLWRIDGTAGAPPPPGFAWSDSVSEGVAVALELSTMPPDLRDRLRIVSVDVSEVADAGPVLLRTAGGAVVEWGRSRAHEFGALERPLAEKFEKLDRALGLYGGLAGVERVRIQFEGLTVTEADVEVRR